MTSETVAEVNKAETSEEDSEVLEFDTEPKTIENIDDATSTDNDEFWEAFEDEKAESLTTIWFCDVSFNIPDKGVARDVFACTTKEKVVNRIFAIIASPELKDPCEFDASKYTTKTQAVRAFFDGIETRNLFVGLVPVF